MAAAVATAPPTADEASPSSIDDLRSALRESLQQRGADAPPPRADPATSTLVVEELVREYLAFAGYGHALSVFEAESRSAERGASITRAQIQHELGVRQDAESAALPLVFGVVETLRAQCVHDRGAAEDA